VDSSPAGRRSVGGLIGALFGDQHMLGMFFAIGFGAAIGTTVYLVF
jgi:hypothetical protein